jgi:hypothetical protein
MVIPIVDVKNILSLEPKDQPNISIHPDRPKTLKRSFQWMEPPSRSVHVFLFSRNVETCQLKTEPTFMGRLNAGFRARQKKFFDSFASKCFYHEKIVTRIFTVVK